MGSNLELLLPQCKVRSLQIVIILITVLFLYIAVTNLSFVVTSGFSFFSLASAAFFLVLSWGLYRLKKWARIAVAIIFLAGAIVLPMGVISPFTAMDYHAQQGREAPEWQTLLLCIAPVVILLLFAVHILGKYKSEFK